MIIQDALTGRLHEIPDQLYDHTWESTVNFTNHNGESIRKGTAIRRSESQAKSSMTVWAIRSGYFLCWPPWRR